MGIGGLSNVETDFVFDPEVDFWKSFSRGASSALAGKSFGKSFLKGAGIKIGPQGIGSIAIGGAEKGLQTVFNNYDLYGKDGIKYFGKDFYWKSFAAGFAGGALKASLGIGFKKIDDLEIDGLDLSVFNVGLNSVAADITKKMALKSMNEKYKLYLKEHKADNSLSFFNGFAQLVMYHTGK